MENQKVIIMPSYYEVHILPFKKETMTAQYFNGVEGVFENRKNVFKNLDTALNYLQKKNFDDSIVIDNKLKSDISEFIEEDYNFADFDKNGLLIAS